MESIVHAYPCDDINCEWCESPTYMAEFNATTGALGPIETIPPVALEASDGGNRQADAPVVSPETGTTPIEGKRYEICPLHRVVHFDATCDGPDDDDIEDLARRRVELEAIAERDARIEMLERERDQAHKAACKHAARANEAIARAERAEATIAKVRADMASVTPGTPRHPYWMAQEVLAILDGKEG